MVMPAPQTCDLPLTVAGGFTGGLHFGPEFRAEKQHLWGGGAEQAASPGGLRSHASRPQRLPGL